MEPTTNSRRAFLKNAGLSGIALTLGIRAFPKNADGTSPTNPGIINPAISEGQSIELMTWISIDKTGKVTLWNHRAEMGRGLLPGHSADNRRRAGSGPQPGQHLLRPRQQQEIR
ncbi:twin-arginine translocation signal domain-containing protein [Puia sp. P3]|uniref:twin-arginine translocation signal domain-containing protein n=1 Tax=Puia sp. P3 TaxID=3423952 RepID=UPI003D666F21